MLSHRLLVFGLVGHYPTNYLISRKLLPKRPEPFFQSSLLERKVRGIRPDFSGLSPSSGQITYVLLSRPPLDMCSPKKAISFDLHALGAPPAFVLSQDQTLNITVSFYYPVVKVLGIQPKKMRSKTQQTYMLILLGITVK